MITRGDIYFVVSIGWDVSRRRYKLVDVVNIFHRYYGCSIGLPR